MSVLDIIKSATSTEESRASLEVARESSATTGEKVRYGMAKGTWMIPDALRWVEAGGDKELLKEREEKRTERINKRFEHLSQEEKDSGWAMAGEIGMDVLDPALLATGVFGASAKIAKLGKTARRLTTGGIWGGVSAGDALIHQVARGDDVNPTMVGVAGLTGGALGLLLPAKGAVNAITSKGPKGDVKTLASREVDSVVPDSNAETSVRQALQAYESGDAAGVSALQGSRNNGQSLEWADNIRKLYRREKRNRAKGRKGAFSDKSWAALERHKKTADEIYDQFPQMLVDHAESGASGLMGGLRALAANETLNSNTARTLVYRPLIGAGAGFGVGATLNLYDDETTYSPWLFAAVGAMGGAASKKLVNSKFSQEIIDATTGEIQNVMRRSMWTQANILFSGSQASRANAFGGKLEALSKTVMSQRGADLKGAASVSLEETKELVLQELNRRWNTTFQRLGLLGRKEKTVGMREDSYKLAEGFIELDDLVAKGYSQAEIDIIEQAGRAGVAMVKSVTDQVKAVGIQLKQDITGYVMPQMHDLSKIRANPEAAREAYIRAFRLEHNKGKGARTPAEIARADKNANAFFQKLMTGEIDGSARPVRNVFDNKASDNAYLASTEMRPLADHFEKARMFTGLEARKELQDFLVTDIDILMKMYTQNSVPIIEFARLFGSGKSTFKEFAGLKSGQLTPAEQSGKGKDGVYLIKQAIHEDFEAARAAAKSQKEISGLNKSERQQMKTVHDMVNSYFGTLHADSFGSNASLGNTIMSFFITGANTTMLTKVTISSLGDIVQPFQNSGVFNALKGYQRSFSKTKDFAADTGFADADILDHELQAYILSQSNPASKVQAGLRAANQFYFRAIGLGKLTGFARRFAYNSGIEDSFKIAKGMSKKATSSLQTRANALGLDDESISILNKFDNVDAAFADEGGQRILNIAGRKAADRDALIPQVGNRRGFSQSRNPYIRSLGQFLSWAQAKTTQTNSLVHRMENGDDALFARMLGLLTVYDGVLTFKEWLGDPTGKFLEDEDSADNYFQRLTTLEQVGKSVNFSGNFSHWFIDKIARLASAHGGSHPSEDIVPALSYASDLYEAFSPAVGDTQGTVWKNLMRGDEEGAALQTIKRLPFGRDINAWMAVFDNELKDAASPAREESRIRRGIGGEVEDVPQVPKEPDERIDKMTGEPYNKQAGGAFIDEEDPLRRLGFVGGGFLEGDPLRRLGFVPGGVISKAGPRIYKAVKDAIGRGTREDPFVFRDVKEATNVQSHASKNTLDRLLSSRTDDNIKEGTETLEALRLVEGTPEGDIGRISETLKARVKEGEAKGSEKLKIIDELDESSQQQIDELEGMISPERGEDEIRQIQDDVRARTETQKKGVLRDIRELGLITHKREREPGVVDALKQLARGEISQKEYDDLVKTLDPIRMFETAPRPALYTEMAAALDSGKVKKGFVGLNISLKDGQVLDSRLDINAYYYKDIWVPSLHLPKGEQPRTVYASTVWLKGVGDNNKITLETDPFQAFKVAMGEQKRPFATAHGAWKNHSPKELYQKAQKIVDDINNPDKETEWIQAGMNPFRHSYFYNRKTGNAIENGDEYIQIGGLVLIKNPLELSPELFTKMSKRLFPPHPKEKAEDIAKMYGGSGREAYDTYMRSKFGFDIAKLRKYFKDEVGPEFKDYDTSKIWYRGIARPEEGRSYTGPRTVTLRDTRPISEQGYIGAAWAGDAPRENWKAFFTTNPVLAASYAGDEKIGGAIYPFFMKKGVKIRDLDKEGLSWEDAIVRYRGLDKLPVGKNEALKNESHDFGSSDWFGDKAVENAMMKTFGRPEIVGVTDPTVMRPVFANTEEAYLEHVFGGAGSKMFFNKGGKVYNALRRRRAEGGVENSQGSYEEMPEPKQLYGEAAIEEVVKREGEVTPAQEYVIGHEGYVFGEYLDSKGVPTSGVGQTGKYRGMSFKDTYDIHRDDAERLVPELDNLSEDQQKAIMSLVYRGDLQQSHTFVSLVNEGNFAQAAVELLDHKEYKDLKKTNPTSGIIRRLDEAADLIKQK